MSSGIGILGHIGLAKETTWGTAVAATDYFEALSEGITSVPDRFETKNIVGNMYEPDDVTGIIRSSGDVTLPTHPTPLGHFIMGTLGNNSGSVVLSGFLFKNEFTVKTSDTSSLHPLPAYTFEVFRDIGSAQQFDGVQISQLQLAVQPNQDLRATASVIAKASRNLAKTTPSFPGSPVGVFTFDTCSVSLGGTGVSIIEALTVTINNQLEGLAALNNSTSIARIKRSGPPQIRVAGTIALEDIIEYQKLINQTEFALVVSLTKANSFALVIDVPRLVYTGFPLGMGGRGRQTVSFAATGRYHTGSSSAIKISLTNTKSDY